MDQIGATDPRTTACHVRGDPTRRRAVPGRAGRWASPDGQPKSLD